MDEHVGSFGVGIVGDDKALRFDFSGGYCGYDFEQLTRFGSWCCDDEDAMFGFSKICIN